MPGPHLTRNICPALREGPPVAALLWCHGLHDHSGRGEKLYESLASRGIAVYAWDFVG